MATISVPTASGGRRTIRMRTGMTVETFLRIHHLQAAAHQWGVERKTARGWLPTPTSTYIQEPDILRIPTPPSTLSTTTNPLVRWLTNLFSSLEKKRR